MYVYQYKLCRRYSISQLSPQRSNKRGICIYICFNTPLLNNIFIKVYSKKPNFVCMYININTGYINIFALTTFHLKGQTNAIYLYAPKLFIFQDIVNKTY